MTPQHVARLRCDVIAFASEESQRTGKPVAFSALQKHIIAIGWNLLDSEMFGDWVTKNTSVDIDFSK